MEPGQVAESLRDALVEFGRDGERARSPCSQSSYDRDVLFRDPLQTPRGRGAFLTMNRRVLGRARPLSFDVKDVIGGRDSLCLAWTTYEMPLGPTLVFEGATHARVQGGAITEQRDYWDLLSTVAGSHSLLRHVYAALAPHLG